MVEYFNILYFLYISLALGLVIGLYLLLRNKSKKVSAAVLFGLLIASFILHFLKLTAEHYQSWMPYSIRTVTPENICAVSVLIFPWFFLSNKKLLKDYMFYMGMISGIGATFIPVDIIGFNAFEFETARFYFAHIFIWVVPLLMVLLKLHTLDYKRIMKVPLLVYLVLCIILVNEVILTGAGFVRADTLYSNEFRNSSLIFGPNPAVGFVGDLFIALTPKIFTTMPVGDSAGAVYYWPIVWLIIPSYIYISIASLLLSLPFEYKNVIKDISSLRTKLVSKKGSH